MPTPAITVRGVDFLVTWVDDFDAALRFYGDVLGLARSQQYGTMPGVEFETGNLTIAVLEAKAFGREFTPRTAPLALRVDDVHAARAALEALGVVFAAQFDSGTCHQALFTDPAGNVLDLHEKYA